MAIFFDKDITKMIKSKQIYLDRLIFIYQNYYKEKYILKNQVPSSLEDFYLVSIIATDVNNAIKELETSLNTAKQDIGVKYMNWFADTTTF